MHIYFPIFPFSFVIFIESVSKLLIIQNPSDLNDLNDSFQISIFRGFKILNVRIFSSPLVRKNCKLIRARMRWIRESSRREHVNSWALHNSTVTNTDGSRRKSGIYRATCVSFPFRWMEKYRDIVVGGGGMLFASISTRENFKALPTFILVYRVIYGRGFSGQVDRQVYSPASCFLIMASDGFL